MQKKNFLIKRKWLKDKHGSENVVGLSIHRDETTPHLVAYVVPIDEKGNLNARHFLGGRNKLSQIQTDFAEHVKGLGLKRGLRDQRQSIKKSRITMLRFKSLCLLPKPTLRNWKSNRKSNCQN